MTVIETPTTARREAWTISPPGYLRVVVVAGVMLAGIIFTGAAVRLTSSGLGCEDWPQCSADRLVPEWGYHAWVEFGNRLLSGLVSMSVIAAVLLGYRRRPRRSDLIRWSWGLVAGVVGQIVLGGITVLVELHPLFVSAHFLLSAVLMWNVLVLAARASTESTTPIWPHDRATLLHSRAVVALAGLVLIAGTLVTGSGPHGGDTRADRLGFDLESISRIHSGVAWLLVATVVWFGVRLRGASGNVPAQLTWLLSVIVLQGAIGYWQYSSGLPAGLVELHVVGAIGVWCATVWMHLCLFDRRPHAPDVAPSTAGAGRP